MLGSLPTSPVLMIMAPSYLSSRANFPLERIIKPVSQNDISKKLTKIVCTIGPASADVEKLVKMFNAGMDVCRFNFSHGTHETHFECLQKVREAIKQVPNRNIALMLDTKGPEIRTGLIASGDFVQLTAGQNIKIISDISVPCTSEVISITYDKLTSSVKPGNLVLIADGSISCNILSVHSNYVIAEVLNSAKLTNRKNVNLPGVSVDLPVIGEKDKNDILNFGVKHDFDYIALSFVQCAEDILNLRKLLGSNSKIKIIPKIENIEGLLNFDSILEESDGIMVARGDLGMEMPLEKVFIAQKMMIQKCNLAGKPVITATQMLESMILNPRPTRAEATDVANAVLDGSDSVMLSGETANGIFNVECVSMMSRICLEAENCTDHDMLYLDMLKKFPVPISIPEAIARCSVEALNSIDAACIIALTETGTTASLIAKYKPKQRIIAVCSDERVMRGLALNRGVFPVLGKPSKDPDAKLDFGIKYALANNIIKSGDTILAIHGYDFFNPGNTNTLKIIKV